MFSEADKARFMDSWVPAPPAGCWLWARSTAQNGYGSFYAARRSWRAHRFSYAIHHGAIPPGLVVCHRCDTPACVNPDHLFLGTQSDNLLDASRKGRLARLHKGLPRHIAFPHWRSHNRKISIEVAISIKARMISGERNSHLAEEFQVDPATIRYAVERATRYQQAVA